MREFEYVIKDKDGIHARPAAELVKAANKFEAKITLSKNEKEADAKRIFGIMGLGAKQGETIKFTFCGADENKAAEEILHFLENNI